MKGGRARGEEGGREGEKWQKGSEAVKNVNEYEVKNYICII